MREIMGPMTTVNAVSLVCGGNWKVKLCTQIPGGNQWVLGTKSSESGAGPCNWCSSTFRALPLLPQCSSLLKGSIARTARHPEKDDSLDCKHLSKAHIDMQMYICTLTTHLPCSSWKDEQGVSACQSMAQIWET